MRRELKFLEDSQYGEPFRPTRGYDYELELTEEEVAKVPTQAGVYIIVAKGGKTKFIYPRGKSPVIYIGEAKDLRRRLRTHLHHLNDLRNSEEEDLLQHVQHCPRYNYMRAFGAYVYLFYCLKKTQDSKTLESWVIEKFYEHYRSIPVGNGARSFTPGK